ncbi:MAG TPA: GNAT family N-acetyltransferase [Alloacidobacterium sp.]|nr:GNAT family N-acetyltransferase [Alloacidobacterium sp.]
MSAADWQSYREGRRDVCDGRTADRIEQVSVIDIFQSSEAPELFAEYAAECSIPLIGEIHPQPAIYEAMENTGMLKCFGVFSDEKLVGFATVFTTILPHYDKKTATLESLFVKAKKRSGGLGQKLIEHIEQSAKEAGCVAILYSAPAGGKLERLLSRKKYVCTNTVYCRSL